MKQKISSVPKWKPKEPANITLLRWRLKRGIADRRERERAETIITDYEVNKRNK